MKICFISDTHSKHKSVTKDIPKDVDVLVHSGDISSRGYVHEVSDFLKWFSKLNIPNLIFIAGNHDFLFENDYNIAKSMLLDYPNVIYLENSSVTIDGVKFYGSPQTPRFFNWAFNVDRGDNIQQYWDLIDKDVDVLITHGPAFGYGDIVLDTNESVGCVNLLNTIEKIKPRYHAFGHIHSGYGVYHNNHTTFVNASVLNESYQYSNKPICVEL